jgi:glutamate-5-semialdehyde dehydrogenase
MIENTLRKVQQASRKLALLDELTINRILGLLADRIGANTTALLEENQRDLVRMPETDPRYDRLKLTDDRLQSIANDLRNVAALPSPLGRILEERSLPNGLQLKKVTVPLGVVGIIYEARPNVTFDVFALCLKSGNACILKGGSDAEYSNTRIVDLIKDVLRETGTDPDVLALLPSDRNATTELLHAVGYVDIIIPRGSQNLINYVRENARVPVIETGAGIVHTYFHESGDAQKGSDIIFNAKTRRVSVCNALDCLIIDQTRLNDLPALVSGLAGKNVRIFADEKSYAVLDSSYDPDLLEKAQPEHFGTEFLDYKMSIRTVASMQEALDHIHTHSSRHSEAIIAEDPVATEQFLWSVDAAAVYANASTAFTDGAQFGLGAEIGISTQKLHARGPMALREMTSYKWIIYGDGTVRVP